VVGKALFMMDRAYQHGLGRNINDLVKALGIDSEIPKPR
jgi:hypothetical protein